LEAFVRAILTLFTLCLMVVGADADDPPAGEEAQIRQVIATWYSELQKGAGREHWRLYAPGAVDGGPGETEINPGSRARSPTFAHELAARALEFAYDVEGLVIDPHLAKVRVWERGYFYAWANQQTYENAASTVFVMEKQPDGRWLILAHQASSVGIPDGKRTVPLPDMKPRWEARGQAPFKAPAAN
jgi:hypothetical protein